MIKFISLHSYTIVLLFHQKAKHKDYTKVGKELKSLVADMRNLISGHNDDAEYDTFNSASESDEAVPRRDPVKKNRDSTKILTSSLQTQGLR